MKLNSIGFPSVLLLWLVSSCSHTITCKHADITMALDNYDSTSDSTCMVIQYQIKGMIGGNLTVDIDTVISTYDKRNRCFHYLFKENTSYKIIVPSRNATHELSEIHFGNETRKGSPGLSSDMCWNSLTYNFDGNIINISYRDSGYSGPSVILKL